MGPFIATMVYQARAGVTAGLENRNSQNEPRRRSGGLVNSHHEHVGRRHRTTALIVYRMRGTPVDWGEHTASFAARADNAGELHRPR